MFTIEQIIEAHSKVRTGADFPKYIQDLIKIGVLSYQTFVSDGHTDYFGVDGFKLSSPAKYDILAIAEVSNADQFKFDLLAHQSGKTDYSTFCSDCARSGVEKWLVDISKMTCTYLNQQNEVILEEQIPS